MFLSTNKKEKKNSLQSVTDFAYSIIHLLGQHNGKKELVSNVRKFLFKRDFEIREDERKILMSKFKFLKNHREIKEVFRKRTEESQQQ